MTNSTPAADGKKSIGNRRKSAIPVPVRPVSARKTLGASSRVEDEMHRTPPKLAATADMSPTSRSTTPGREIVGTVSKTPNALSRTISPPEEVIRRARATPKVTLTAPSAGTSPATPRLLASSASAHRVGRGSLVIVNAYPSDIGQAMQASLGPLSQGTTRTAPSRAFLLMSTSEKLGTVEQNGVGSPAGRPLHNNTRTLIESPAFERLAPHNQTSALSSGKGSNTPIPDLGTTPAGQVSRTATLVHDVSDPSVLAINIRSSIKRPISCPQESLEDIESFISGTDEGKSRASKKLLIQNMSEPCRSQLTWASGSESEMRQDENEMTPFRASTKPNKDANVASPKSTKSSTSTLRQSIGTPVSMRKAMAEEMLDMRAKWSQSIGPEFFARSTQCGRGFRSVVGNVEASIAENEAAGILESSQKENEGMSVGKMSGGLQQCEVAAKTPKGNKKQQQKVGTSATKEKYLERQRIASDCGRRRVGLCIQTPLRPHAPLSPSPRKGESASQSIPRGARTSIFDLSPSSSASKPPRKLITSPSRLSKSTAGLPTPKSISTPLIPSPDLRSHEQKFASAQDISNFIQKITSEDRKRAAAAPPHPTKSGKNDTPGSSPTKPMMHLNARTTRGESHTPNGSPTKPMSSAKSRVLAVTPTTPAPKKTVAGRRLARDHGAVRTPSKEIESALDRAIDERIAEDAGAGRRFTPSGNRIVDLLEAKRWSTERK